MQNTDSLGEIYCLNVEFIMCKDKAVKTEINRKMLNQLVSSINSFVDNGFCLSDREKITDKKEIALILKISDELLEQLILGTAQLTHKEIIKVADNLLHQGKREIKGLIKRAKR